MPDSRTTRNCRGAHIWTRARCAGMLWAFASGGVCMRRIALLVSCVLVAGVMTLAATPLAGSSATAASAGAARVRADFNHDGFSDLAVGVPGQTVGAQTLAGGVAVIFGSSTGLTSAHNQFFTQATRGIPTD